MRDYHDEEWGRPVTGESAYFERMTLEAFQSGLSWATILAKRPAFREVFAGFDADAVADYDEADVERLMGERTDRAQPEQDPGHPPERAGDGRVA